MKDQLITILFQFILTALGIVATAALAKLTIYLSAKKTEVVSNNGAVAYNHALEIAKGLYFVLEDEFKALGKTGLDKRDEMSARLLEIFPQITATELAAINKSVWDEINNKVIIPILTPVDIKTVPVAEQAITSIVQPSEAVVAPKAGIDVVALDENKVADKVIELGVLPEEVVAK